MAVAINGKPFGLGTETQARELAGGLNSARGRMVSCCCGWVGAGSWVLGEMDGDVGGVNWCAGIGRDIALVGATTRFVDW